MKPEEKIFLAYFESKKSELYFNQIKELTNLSDSSLAHNLKKLLSQKLLSVNKTKSNSFYKITNKKIFTLKFSELAVLKFNDLNRGVRIPLKYFLNNLPLNIYSVILFGSASKKEEQKGSDIDLLIVSDMRTNFDVLKNDANVTSNYPISIFSCSVDDFVENKDQVIIQARKTGFPIKGEQYFYEVLTNKYL